MSDGSLTLDRAAAGERSAPGPHLLRLLSDERLVKLAARGSSPAFAAIYQRHHQALYRYCRSILRSEEDARDALQNAMLKALQGLEGEERQIALRPWLFRIAHNEAITLLRRRRPDANLEGVAELAAPDTDPQARDRLRALISDLELLSERQRSALVMRELSGLEFAEIATALETSPSAAKQAVYEARLALHDLEEGREMSCLEVRRKISAEDRRLLRGRKLRGHLRACSDCAAFEASMGTRKRQLAALAPPLPAPAALGILEGVLGGVGGSGGGGIASLAGSGAVAGLGPTALKLGIAGIIAVGVGTTALENDDVGSAAASSDPPVEETSQPADATGTADGAREGRDANGGRRAAAPSDGRRGGRAGRGGGERGGPSQGVAGAQSGAGADSFAPASPPASPGSPPAPPASPPAPPGSPPAGAGAPPAGTEPPASGGPKPGGGPASPPPGHGGVPPGHGGVPPGLGAPPPGHSVAPPHGGTPPGQGGTPPGPPHRG